MPCKGNFKQQHYQAAAQQSSSKTKQQCFWKWQCQQQKPQQQTAAQKWKNNDATINLRGERWQWQWDINHYTKGQQWFRQHSASSRYHGRRQQRIDAGLMANCIACPIHSSCHVVMVMALALMWQETLWLSWKAIINARKSERHNFMLSHAALLTDNTNTVQVAAVPALASDRRDFKNSKMNNQPAATATVPVSQPTEARGDNNITEHWQWHCGSSWLDSEWWCQFFILKKSSIVRSNNQLVGREGEKAMALPMVMLNLQALLQCYHWMTASGGGAYFCF